MDARITKQRLGNLISYDWLKMLVTIVCFVLVLVLLFTMTATRPRNTQEYGVYAYTDLSTTSSFSNLGETLLERDVFSYDILAVSAEGFSGNNYASATYSARRAAGQGTVMLLTDNRVYQTDENGEPVVETESQLYSFTGGVAFNAPGAITTTYDRVLFAAVRGVPRAVLRRGLGGERRL